jgi:PKD repeat protein
MMRERSQAGRRRRSSGRGQLRRCLPQRPDLHRCGRPAYGDAGAAGRSGVRPLEYSFDFDDDGKPEVTGASTSASHVYPRAGRYTIRVDVKDGRWGTTEHLTQKVEVR